MAIMHIFIQCPRLNSLVRHAITNPQDTAALVEAVTLAESLWQLNLPDQVSALLQESLTIVPTAPSDDLADIITNSLEFNSVQNMILCTRYWMLINVLGGLVDTLYRHFHVETTMSLLPDRYVMHKLETEAAMQLAKSIPWADSVSHSLPLVPLRLHTPLQISIGPWYRTIRRLEAVRSASPGLDPGVIAEMARTINEAKRMKDNIITYCNSIHRTWDISTVSETPLLEALNTMAGEPIPDWLPIRIRFEAEDGEMVMKLDYENKSGSYQERFDIGDHPPKRARDRDLSLLALDAEKQLTRKTAEASARPSTVGDYIEAVYSSSTWKPRNAADFIHSTGRNLCSTSGWWPRDDEPSHTVLLESTHTASGFQKKLKIPQLGSPDTGESSEYIDRHPCLASSFWPQTPNSSSRSHGSTPKNVCLSPAWSSPRFFNTTLNQKNTNTPMSECTSLDFMTSSSDETVYTLDV